MIWQLIGFLGRYAHQPAAMLLDMSVIDLDRFARAVAKIMEEEAEAVSRRSQID